MVMLIPYNSSFEIPTLARISDFFGFHHTLVPSAALESSLPASSSDDSRITLNAWQVHPNALFVIMCEEVYVGFIRINYRGPNVAWIEDIFVDPSQRGHGIASAAIAAAEAIIRHTPGYTAVCLDVSPRNENALRLYHRLGYNGLSLITIRKEFGGSKCEVPISLLDLDFKY
jgi:ribosomal protein S18 acetylase RimI-like enzyme